MNSTDSMLAEEFEDIFERETTVSIDSSQPLVLGEELYSAALLERARRAEQILPEITRHLLSLTMDHPLANLPNSQLKVCFLLMSGAKTMSQIGESLAISVSAVTQLADRLETLGLVERQAIHRNGEGDRRIRSLALTAHGTDLMNQWRQRWIERFASTLAVLNPVEQDSVVAALETLLSACRQAK